MVQVHALAKHIAGLDNYTIGEKIDIESVGIEDQ